MIASPVPSEADQENDDNRPTPDGLLAGYTPLPGAMDECIASDGTTRPAWQPAMALWNAQDPSERDARHRAADRYLRDNGVAHRVYGSGASSERPWPISHVPLLINATEWSALEKGLIQRAHLLEAVLKDLYGPQTLVRDAHLPATLVAGSPGFIRPMINGQSNKSPHLHFLAFDLGRGPDGRWWVLGDRTQAPSGTGYALENRLATARAAGPDLRSLRVRRLARFFQDFRETMGALRGPGSSRVGLLTPGPFNETYYEQAFLARYLGWLLLEGGDLIAEADGLYVRTVRGLKRLDVLWRRLDADFCDPLELRADSRLGVPGFVKALRSGALTCANGLGAGLVESRGFMAFFPHLAQTLLDEDLAVPNIATWWLGDKKARQAIEHGDVDTSLVHLSAYGTALPMDADDEAASFSGGRRSRDQVAQEVVRLSTMPSLEPGEGGALTLRPRPFSVRVFLARTQEGWSVMPGGFCRVADTDDTRAISMQDGSRSADVWVLDGKRQEHVSLLPGSGPAQVRRVPGTLPARAADNLFWLGRYTERAQITMRLALAYLERRVDGAPKDDPLLITVAEQLERWGIKDPDVDALFERSVLPVMIQARDSASSIRDRFSPDAWRTLNQFVEAAKTHSFAQLSPLEKIESGLATLAAFSGLASENMIRLTGWRFLEIGRRIERAAGTCQIARALCFPDPPAGTFDLLLEVADSVMSYRQRYSVTTDRTTVIDLVVLDPNNPRSVAFQLERIQGHIDALTDHRAFEQQSDLQRLAMATWSKAYTCRAASVTESWLATTEEALRAMSETIIKGFVTPGTAGRTIQQ
ncbi:MAG: circularly permuted type 2 ATP-grasp protein [Cohaesibacteraceae bacterium]